MKKTIWLLAILLMVGAADASSAQTRSKTRKKTAKAEPVKTNQQTVSTASEPSETLPNVPPKKNERAETDAVPNAQENAPKKTNRSAANSAPANKATSLAALPFFYEFKQSEFTVSRVVIEHDASGKGKITFEKKNWNESLTDPLQISPVALERINNLYKELNFLDSTEEYQSKQYDYKHLGVMTLRVEDSGKRREVTFNWTDNKAAENLTKEYKRLTEQSVWMFDINLARENQPLEAPKLMERLDSLVKRGEISDGEQMLPFLRELADDERIPLISRNHAARIIKQIEKQKK
jgi:hypothetical protein